MKKQIEIDDNQVEFSSLAIDDLFVFSPENPLFIELSKDSYRCLWDKKVNKAITNILVPKVNL